MSNTNFDKVLEFNKAFNIITNDIPSPQVLFNENLIKNRLDLVKEKFEKLQQALKEKNFIEIIDTLAYIEYVILGFYTALGVDANKAFDIVHKSNMSKLCASEKEAQETVDYYLNNPGLGYSKLDYKISNDNKHFIVYNEPTKKILKSINYTPANFNSIVKQDMSNCIKEDSTISTFLTKFKVLFY